MLETLFVEFLFDGEVDERLFEAWEHFSELSNRREDVDVLEDDAPDRSTLVYVGDISGTFCTFYGTEPDPEGGRFKTPDVPHVEFDLEELKLDLKTSERVEQLLELVTIAVESFSAPPSVAYGLPSVYGNNVWSQSLEIPVSEESLANDRVEYFPWLTILPPAMVETYGRERVLDAPAWRVEELDDDSVLLVAYENPLEEPDTEALHEHFGMTDPWAKFH